MDLQKQATHSVETGERQQLVEQHMQLEQEK